MWTCVIVILLTIQIYSCKPSYRDYIPNGYNVPNPCVSPGVWNAVGHYNPLHHTLIKNKFGRDFTSALNSWSLSLCRMDSDRDNRTNGEELGDPNCEWFEGQAPSSPPKGHPDCGLPFTSSGLLSTEHGLFLNMTVLLSVNSHCLKM